MTINFYDFTRNLCATDSRRIITFSHVDFMARDDNLWLSNANDALAKCEIDRLGFNISNYLIQKQK